MMTFSESRDGKLRATIRTSHRVGLDRMTLVLALGAVERMGRRGRVGQWPEEECWPRSRAEVEQWVRWDHWMFGRFIGDEGNEAHSQLMDCVRHVWKPLMAAARTRVVELYPELGP